MNLRYDTVSFLSDLGRADEHVGVCHAVLRSLAPTVHVIDLGHELARADVRAGGLALARAAQYACPGVVIAAVGADEPDDRPPVAISVGGGVSVLVGPDNGVLAAAVALVGGADEAVALTNDEFHLPTAGAVLLYRDVLAPAAAHLCLGVPLPRFGPPVDANSLLPGVLPVAERSDGELVAEVLWVDGRGNVQLNAGPDDLEGWGDDFQLWVGQDLRRARRVVRAAECGAGEVGVRVDPYGLLSLVVDRGSAAADLRLDTAAQIRLVPTDAVVPSVSVELGRRGD